MMAASAVLSTASTMRASDGAGSPVAGEGPEGGFAAAMSVVGRPVNTTQSAIGLAPTGAVPASRTPAEGASRPAPPTETNVGADPSNVAATPPPSAASERGPATKSVGKPGGSASSNAPPKAAGSSGASAASSLSTVAAVPGQPLAAADG